MKMLKAIYILFLLIVSSVAISAEVKTDSEIWNEGVDLYNAGDVTNALAVLRGLMLSQSHGARAAELVAKLEYDAARDQTTQNVLEKLEEAAAAAQIALRASSGDPRLERNFSLAVADIPQLRERKHIDDVLARYKDKQPAQILKTALDDSRLLVKGVPKLKEDILADPEKAISAADDYSARSAALADAWIAVKEAVCQTVTNQEQAAEISQRVDSLRVKTVEASDLIADLNLDAAYPLAEAEAEFTNFYKAFVLPPEAIQTGLECQTNAYAGVDLECGRPWQNEALDYTRAFRAKFPAWAQAYEQAAAADTNKPPFTAEAQQKISALSTDLEKLQIECVTSADTNKQAKAVSIATEIIKLLPKDGKGGSSQQPPPQQDKPKQNENKDKKQENDSGDSSDENQGEDQPEQADKKDSKENAESKEEKQLQDILKRAQERSDEHEAEKKARARRARLPPNERDW